jgi:hypothetical protein
MLPDSAYALDSGWNRYSNSEFKLMFEYPGFLNDLEEIGTQMGQQGGDTSTPIMNTWVFENRKWTINLSQSDESRSQIIMSVSIGANGRVFAISICDACMKSVLTDQFGDYNSVVDRILRSLRWIE